jgi:hypothetical protein
MAARAYVVDIAGGTATATVQIQATQTLREAVFNYVNAAAGKIELSLSSTSQIGTAQPDTNVLCRTSCSAGANQVTSRFTLAQPVKAFQSIYVHCTGAGNLGTATLR